MSAHPITLHAAHFPSQARGILVIANPAQDARATAGIVASLHARDGGRIHVAALQVPPTGYARSFLKSIRVRALLRQSARRSIEPLCRELDARGLRYRTHVEVGPWLAGIARLAKQLGCSQVTLGVNPRNALRDFGITFDRWLIAGALRREGLTCRVTRGDESARAGDAGAAPGSALAP